MAEKNAFTAAEEGLPLRSPLTGGSLPAQAKRR
jgi:hypothetical protein